MTPPSVTHPEYFVMEHQERSLIVATFNEEENYFMRMKRLGFPLP